MNSLACVGLPTSKDSPPKRRHVAIDGLPIRREPLYTVKEQIMIPTLRVLINMGAYKGFCRFGLPGPSPVRSGFRLG